MFEVIKKKLHMHIRRVKGLKEDDFILRDIRAFIHDPKGQFHPIWVEHFVIKKI